MRTLFRYTLNTIRLNKRTSISIMVSVLLASTLLCAMCTYGYTEIKWRIEIEEYESGQWHGELGGDIPAGKLKLAEDNLYVEATMLKGPFTCLELPEGSRLPYLLLRDADENYWNMMGEKNTIIEARVPERPGEIAVSKSFFEYHPEYRLGDTISFPEGERRVGEELLEAALTRREGERFFRTGEREVTLVGKMDLTTNTTVPGYYAMGYMDREALSDQDELVIYVKLKDIRKTYEVMPQIADAMGIGKDEYGRYENHFAYHTMLLALNFVFPPDAAFSLENIGQILIYAAIVLLVMGAFVMIICGAFQVSASARMKQLGMFRSVGATPGQIAVSILMEGVVLSAAPILLSLGVGYGFTVVIMRLYTDIAGEFLYFPIKVRFSLWAALLSAALSFLTVLASAFWPALKISRLSPLEAIRMQEGTGKKERRERKGAPGKRRVFPRRGDRKAVFGGLFGYEGELARASHRANRKGFRAGVWSLSFCLMLLMGFFSFMSLNDYLSERNRSGEDFNIFVRLDMGTEADRELLQSLQDVPGEEESVYYCVTRAAYWAGPEKETEEFRERGGFGSLDLNRWAIVNRDGKYRIRVYLYGMQEERFDEYCRQWGEEPAGFYDTEKVRAVAWSAAPVYPEVLNNAQKEKMSYSHLKLSRKEELTLEEKTEDSMETDYTFPIEVGAVAGAGPGLGDVRNNYTINLYMPLPVYYSVVGNLSEEKEGKYYTYVKVKTAPENDLAATARITELCEAVMAKEDIYIASTALEEENNAAGKRAMEAVVDCIGILLGLIGVSNTLSAVSHTMMRRRREFAMLRSVGMDAQGVKRLLGLEGIRMAVMPVFISVPVIALLLQVLMGLVDVSWLDFLPCIPWGKIFFGIGAVMAAVTAAYWMSAGKIRKDTIIEAVRDENV